MLQKRRSGEDGVRIGTFTCFSGVKTFKTKNNYFEIICNFYFFMKLFFDHSGTSRDHSGNFRCRGDGPFGHFPGPFGQSGATRLRFWSRRSDFGKFSPNFPLITLSDSGFLLIWKKISDPPLKPTEILARCWCTAKVFPN